MLPLTGQRPSVGQRAVRGQLVPLWQTSEGACSWLAKIIM